MAAPVSTSAVEVFAPRAWRAAGPLAAILVAGCGASIPNGAGTPLSGPASSQCRAGEPPAADVTTPADTCGVHALAVIDPNLPKANLAPLQLDLYIGLDEACIIGGPKPTGCLEGDNRPYVDKSSPDPHAAPSRTRVHLTLYFKQAAADLRISPSCRVHPFGVGFNSEKECFAPKQLNQGNEYAVTSNTSDSRAWVIHILIVALQTDYPAPAGIAQLHNDWTMVIDPSTGVYTMTGSGSSFPDFALITNGVVSCAYPETYPARLIGFPVNKNLRHYHCRGVDPLSGALQPMSSPSHVAMPFATCSMQAFAVALAAAGGKNIQAFGNPVCASEYGMGPFIVGTGTIPSQFFFKRDAARGWAYLFNDVPDLSQACSSIPYGILAKLIGPQVYSCP
jgi:hypothetical protein